MSATSNSLIMTIIPPRDTNGIDRYTVSIIGNDNRSCEIESSNPLKMCIISSLSPGSKYALNATAWMGGQHSSIGASIWKEVRTKPSSKYPFSLNLIRVVKM